MEITLPVSGHKVTLRDTMLRGDRRMAQKAIEFTVLPDGSRVMNAAIVTNLTGVVLRRMIVAWGVPQPLPRDAQTDELAQGILDTLEDEDSEALAEAVSPFVKKILAAEGAVKDPNSVPGNTGTTTSAEQDGQATLT